jgi:hypothetical protein
MLTAPSILPEPLVDTIELPRTGESTTCRFPIGVVPASPSRFEARISVLFRNRFLQTAILSGPVVTDPGAARGGPEEITVEVEANVRPGLMDRLSRRHFDLALLFNHTDGDRAAMHAVAGDDVDLVIPANLDQEVEYFRQLLSGVAANAAGYTSLTSPEAVTLMIALARHGTFLRDNLFGQGFDTVRQATRIQVVSAHPDQIVPIEFVYERSSPTSDAESAQRGGTLPDGACATTPEDALPNRHVPARVLRTRKVIERATLRRWERHLGPGDPVEGGDEPPVLHWRSPVGARRSTMSTRGCPVGAHLTRRRADTPQANTRLDTARRGTDPSLLALPRIRTGDGREDAGDRRTRSPRLLRAPHVRRPENACRPSSPFQLQHRDHGDALSRARWSNSSAGPAPIGVVATITAVTRLMT